MRRSTWLVLVGALVGCSGPRTAADLPTAQQCSDILELPQSCEVGQRCDYDRLRCDCVPYAFSGGAPQTTEPSPEPITEVRFHCRDQRCPETFPDQGTPCNPSGLTCSAGVGESSDSAICEDGTWRVEPGEIPASGA